jgi:hypothetical protein
MNRKLLMYMIVLTLLGVGSAALAQELKIDCNLDLNPGAKTSYFTFSGSIRSMAADKDHLDAASGASVQKSTVLFQPYLYDVKGKVVLSSAMRGVFLFAPGECTDDNLTVTKAADGTITIRYVHRGTANEIATDKSGKIIFPNANIRKRNIGFIVGEKPQVISKDFSSDGTAAKVDWNKVWDAGIAAGKEIAAGNAAKTGTIGPDLAAADSMYYWSGELQVTFDRNVLKITGGLSAVKR